MDKSLDEIIEGRQHDRRYAGGRSDSRISKSHGRDFHTRRRPAPRITSMIKISNLHYELTEDDIYDLLSKVGEVRSVRLDYDISGRSIGTAIANFNSPYEAEEAVRRFNGRKAAGVIISVELYYHNSDRRAPRYDSRGGASSSHRRREPQPRRGNDDRDRSDAKPFRRGERAPRKAKKTLEELDAELTSYMNGGSGDAPDTETSNSTSHHDNNEPSSNNNSNDHSNDNNNSSIQPNNSSNFGDSNASSTAAESSNDQHPPAHKDDDEMVLD